MLAAAKPDVRDFLFEAPPDRPPVTTRLQEPLFAEDLSAKGDDDDSLAALRQELSDTRAALDEALQRNISLVQSLGDTEKRLEAEAVRTLELEGSLVSVSHQASERLAAAEAEREAWRTKCDKACLRERRLGERLARTERELYRMHTRKYDLKKQVRQEEASRRAEDEASGARLRQEQAELDAAKARKLAEEQAVAMMKEPRAELKRSEARLVDHLSGFFFGA